MFARFWSRNQQTYHFGPGHLARAAPARQCHIPTMQCCSGELAHGRSTNPLVAFLIMPHRLVERTASSIVAVHGGGEGPQAVSIGVPASSLQLKEVLERDEEIKITLPGGRPSRGLARGPRPQHGRCCAALPAGRTARGAYRRCSAAAPGSLSSWQLEITKALRSPASASSPLWEGPWHNVRGGTIDNLIRVDLALSPAAEGGALIDALGRIVGMTVLGRVAACSPFPRRQLTGWSISSWRKACFSGISWRGPAAFAARAPGP